MSYPLQYFRIAIGNTDNNIVASNKSLAPSHHTGKTTEKWYLVYIKSGVFQVVNASNNLVLTRSGTNVSLASYSNSNTQYWTFKGVQKDYDGYYLYYSILNNGDTSKALTYTANKGFSLATYSGTNYQKFKVNLDGLEGFAANCKTSSGEKAGTIGGLFGPVVEVTTADQLETQLKSVGAQTIVINANINMKDKMHTRIRDNKTIVGSFKYKTLYDPHFRTNNEYGIENDNPSDNIVFRNLDMQAKNVSNRILINIWSSRQIWIDHVNFNSSLNYDRTGNGQDEVGKFIWLNTPYESYMDKKDRLRSPDYITISYCKLTNRYWTVAYGTQNDEITRDRTTLLYNWWNQNVRRCPQLGNGIMHVYNNYYQAYGQKNNGSATTGIIGGDGSEVVSQNNMFNGYTKTQALMMGSDTNKNPARDDNSYFSADLNATPTQISFSAKKTSSWYPNKSNYGYRLLDAYNTKNTDTKAFCTKYAGCFNSQNGIKYITDSDLLGWATTTNASPFLTHIDFSGSSSSGSSDSGSSSGLTSGATYRIKNVNSSLYMQVDSAKQANGTNVQQWGTSGNSVHDVWKLVNAGSGYYYLISQIGDGNTYYLNVAGSSSGNGTNIEIYKSTGGDSQKFMLTKNSDGSYIIKTKVSNNQSAVEVANAGKGSGENIQQWSLNNYPNQNWIFEYVNSSNGLTSGATYRIKNVNSSLYMQVDSAKQANGTNVQQWGTSGNSVHDVWKLVNAGSGYYYLISQIGDGNTYYLNVAGSSSGNGTNIVLHAIMSVKIQTILGG